MQRAVPSNADEVLIFDPAWFTPGESGENPRDPTNPSRIATNAYYAEPGTWSWGNPTHWKPKEHPTT